MKKIVLIVVLVFLLGQWQIYACSSFSLKDNNNVVFGYNFDWYSGHGFVVTNNRGVNKTAFMPFNVDKPISWVSKYGSITFNTFGKELPTVGINEKGLVLSLMWLDDAKFEEADDRASIALLQWIQFQLDNSATIEEVIQSNKNLRITNKIAVPLHFMVSDSQGNTATIEFLDGRFVHHTGNELPIPLLCNDKYDKSVNSLVEFMDFGSNDSDVSKAKEMVKGKYVDDRFIKGTKAIKEFHQKENANMVESAFDILGVMNLRSNRWRIVFDITNQKIYYKSDINTEIKKIEFNDFKYDCSSQSMMKDINTDKDDIKNTFENFTVEKNKQYLSFVAENVVPTVKDLKDLFPMEFWNLLGNYPAHIVCE